MNKKTIKEMNPTPCKSIIRRMWVQMRLRGDNTFKAKKATCLDVLSEAIENHYIKTYTGEYMSNKIKSMRSENALQKYLINSKNYFEKNFCYTDA